jgi:putative glycerol-1-phosphate prenyltransferase
LAILVDPDKTKDLDRMTVLAAEKKVDALLVGGSLISHGSMDETIQRIKKNYAGPVVIFPGDVTQTSPFADAILFLSLISGRNADLLIGKHVLSAPILKKSGIEVVACGYMLVNSGTPTSVEYISNTVPIPHNKSDIASATAMAGEMLGLKCIYMESGSGAEQEVSMEMIEQVSKSIDIPLIIGGGIKSKAGVELAWKAGATMVVVGTAVEENPDWLAS